MGDNVIKLVVIGDIGVGKTSIIRRYVESEYSPEYRISVQLDFKQKQVSLGETKLNLQLWDVPGNERFGGMTSVYYKYSRGALVTFDLARCSLAELLSFSKENISDGRLSSVEPPGSQITSTPWNLGTNRSSQWCWWGTRATWRTST